MISKSTSQTMLSLLETVVTEGSGSNAKIPGYRIGGKTGTAQIIDGRYAQGKYIASFVAVAPIDDPKLAMLVVVDEPSAGTIYGGSVAAPVAKSILEETFSYLEIAPNITDESENQIMQMVQVPDVKSKTIGEAGKF